MRCDRWQGVQILRCAFVFAVRVFEVTTGGVNLSLLRCGHGNSPNRPDMGGLYANPDLAADPAARQAEKDETVAVEFADRADALVNAVGPNRYLPGNALITGSTGDRWCVSRDPVYRLVTAERPLSTPHE